MKPVLEVPQISNRIDLRTDDIKKVEIETKKYEVFAPEKTHYVEKS